MRTRNPIRWYILRDIAHNGGFGIVEEFAEAVVRVGSVCHASICVDAKLDAKGLEHSRKGEGVSPGYW